MGEQLNYCINSPQVTNSNIMNIVTVTQMYHFSNMCIISNTISKLLLNSSWLGTR